MLSRVMCMTPSIMSTAPRPLLMRTAALHATRMQEADFGFDSAPRPPSEKQVQYAMSLGQKVSMDVPQAALTDSAECSAFIDMALSKAPPTDKQIAFAQSIATSANIELPESALVSSKSISKYIEANKPLAPGPAGGGGFAQSGAQKPTEKQILFAATLASQLGIGLAPEVLQTRLAMSAFLDESQQLVKERGGQYGGNKFGGGGGWDGAAGGGSYAPTGGGGGFGSVGGMPTAAAGVGAMGAFSNGATVGGEANGIDDVAAAADELDGLFSMPQPGEDDEPPYIVEKNVPF